MRGGLLRPDRLDEDGRSGTGRAGGAKSKIDHDGPNSPESKLVGGPIQKNKEMAAKANPINYIDKDDAPVLMLHGDADPLVPLGQ